jgi:hypothetical protein
MSRSKYVVCAAAGCAVVLSLFTSQLRAEDNKDQKSADETKVAHFVLHPADVPYVPLKYRLLPSYIEQTPGNAATHYFRAAEIWANHPPYQSAKDKIADWCELPLDKLRTHQEAQDFFNGCPTMNFDVIRLAARRDHCDWELPIREYNISTHIPELQKIRDLARLIAFKARIEMSRGQIDDAIETLKTGLAMARHAGQGQTLVNALVAIAMEGMMLNQLGELIEDPRCPNLYWSLSVLPDPFIDMHANLDAEHDFVYLMLPELRDIRNAHRTDAEWDAALLKVADALIKVVPDFMPQSGKEISYLGAGAYFAVTAYPKAKAQLLEAGYTKSQIDAMPSSQAILTATVESLEKNHTAVDCWLHVASPEAFRGIDEVEKQVETKSEVIPLSKILIPALRKVKTTEVRGLRQMEAMRCLEALRLNAAKHGGQLPEQLSQIKEVPIPNDPVTGQPFSYQKSGDGAVLTSPAPPGEKAEAALRWEIAMEGAKK